MRVSRYATGLRRRSKANARGTEYSTTGRNQNPRYGDRNKSLEEDYAAPSRALVVPITAASSGMNAVSNPRLYGIGVWGPVTRLMGASR